MRMEKMYPFWSIDRAKWLAKMIFQAQSPSQNSEVVKIDQPLTSNDKRKCHMEKNSASVEFFENAFAAASECLFTKDLVVLG